VEGSFGRERPLTAWPAVFLKEAVVWERVVDKGDFCQGRLLSGDAVAVGLATIGLVTRYFGELAGVFVGDFCQGRLRVGDWQMGKIEEVEGVGCC